MQMIRMVSTSTQQYRGHRLAVGEEFDIEEQHVDLFEKHKWAKRKGEPMQYNTRAMTAGPGRKRKAK